MIKMKSCLVIGCDGSGGLSPAPPEFKLEDLFNNGEKGGLFIYNQNVFEDVEGTIPATTEVALICNSLGEQRRNLFSYSELALGTDSFQQKTASVQVVGSWSLLNNNDYAYMRQSVDLDREYTLSCYIKCSDGSLPVINRANNTGDASLVFEGNSVASQNKNIGDNIIRVSYTGKSTRELTSFGVVKYANQSNKEIQATKFQLELGDLTDYQRVNNYGEWAGLALYTTFDKSEIFNNELVNRTMIFNDNEGLDSCTVIIQLGDELSVLKNVDCNGGVFSNSFTKLFIINRDVSGSELANIIGAML